MHPNTIKFHLKKLLKLGIIRPVTLSEEGIVFPRREQYSRVLKRKSDTNEVIYRLVRPGSRIICKLLIRYGNSLINDEISKIMMDYIEQMKNLRKQDPWPKNITSFKSSVNLMTDAFYDFFPLPFCA
jgi:hypothetical protein